MRKDPGYLSVACPTCKAKAGTHCHTDNFKFVHRARIELAPAKTPLSGAYLHKRVGCRKALASDQCKRGIHEKCKGKCRPSMGVRCDCSCPCHGNRRISVETAIDTKFERRFEETK